MLGGIVPSRPALCTNGGCLLHTGKVTTREAPALTVHPSSVTQRHRPQH